MEKQPGKSGIFAGATPSLHVRSDRASVVMKHQPAFRPIMVPAILLEVHPLDHVSVDWERPGFLPLSLPLAQADFLRREVYLLPYDFAQFPDSASNVVTDDQQALQMCRKLFT